MVQDNHVLFCLGFFDAHCGDYGLAFPTFYGVDAQARKLGFQGKLWAFFSDKQARKLGNHGHFFRRARSEGVFLGGNYGRFFRQAGPESCVSKGKRWAFFSRRAGPEAVFLERSYGCLIFAMCRPGS